jgi:hypothetical protein
MRALKLVLAGCGVPCDSASKEPLSEVWLGLPSAEVALSASTLAVGAGICKGPELDMSGTDCNMQNKSAVLQLAQRRKERLLVSFWGLAKKRGERMCRKTFNEV